jgi:hypothetical protein
MQKMNVSSLIKQLAALGCVWALGCARPLSRGEPTPDYLIKGAVHFPGPYSFGGVNQSLVKLIGHAGGMTEDAVYTRVEFVYDGVTNRFNLRRIAAGELEDPIVPVRSVVRVRRAVE